MELNKIYQGDCLEVLKTFPSESINCVMTSPPYWALRDYGIEGQLGLEPTFDMYIKHLCDIFDEVKRVLRKDGTCWVNIGDTYFGGGNNRGNTKTLSDIQKGNCGAIGQVQQDWSLMDYSDKCLCMIPFRFAIEMQNRGWILRNVIIWHKPNCMPSSVKDRFTVDFEYLFFFVKNKKYWFETQYEPFKQSSIERMGRKWCGSKHERLNSFDNGQQFIPSEERMDKDRWLSKDGRNKRTVWSIVPSSFHEAHFATYPEELCETPLKSGCPEFVCNKCGNPREKIFEYIKNEKKRDIFLNTKYEDVEQEKDNRQGFDSSRNYVEPTIKEKGYTDCGCNVEFSGGVVLDIFFGAGTTGLVALKQNKKFIGIELNPKYIEIAKERLKPYLEQTKLKIEKVKGGDKNKNGS